jgi:hypothetical protein
LILLIVARFLGVCLDECDIPVPLFFDDDFRRSAGTPHHSASGAEHPERFKENNVPQPLDE